MIPLQLSFDFLYDEKLEHQLEHSLHFSHSQAKFLLFIPEFWLIIDSSLKLITGYYENGVVIIDKSKIVKHYLKKGLILDFLSYFPIIAQTILKTNLLGVTVLKFLQLLMFCKIKRVQIILTNFQEMISLKGKNDYILSLVNLLYQIMFFTHIMACVWHAVAYYNVYDGESNWLNANNMKELDWVTRYLNSLFWAVSVMTTISNNHLTPQNNIELVFGILIFLVSSVFFGYALNSMREIFNLMSKSETEYK